MRIKRILSLLLAAACTASLLSGCGSAGPNADPAPSGGSEHAPITMQISFRNTSALADVIHQKYPEINLEIIPYSGKNYSAYVAAQLAVGDMPDIYCASSYVPGREDLSDRLMDLSGYAFTDNYAEARLRDVSDNGAIYLLPTFYNCIGITYNKTLLEKHGWTLPTSLQELRELAPQVEAAGCRLALCQLQLPGYGFQYLCDILDTCYLNTLEGRDWQRRFLRGEATAAGTPELLEAMSTLETWRELGMLAGGVPDNDNATRLMMAEGNTLFLLGSSNTFTEEETTDEFGMIPYLSEDGSRNAFILSVSRYVGLNKHLEDEGNEQKLEDALHVMEVLSTVEGMQALNSSFNDSSLLPLKGYQISSDGYYADLVDQLNSGFTAPLIYSGWENIIVPVGNAVIAYIQGQCGLDAVIRALDDSQYLLEDNSDAAFTTLTEKLDTDDCARLVGICFAQASGADLALISKNKYYPTEDSDELNPDGVSGALYPLPVTDQEITSILPTGWRQNIQTVTLTGRQIRELAENGYDRNGDGLTYPYELVTREGFTLEDDAAYTVAICGVTSAVAGEGRLTDTPASSAWTPPGAISASLKHYPKRISSGTKGSEIRL